jgi:hypothetical protein
MTQGSHEWTYPWGIFFTSSQFYKFCFKDIIPHISFKWLWKSRCTPRVKFFVWLILSDRINTRNMLMRRKFILNSSYQCLMCSNPLEETIEHMLFCCPFSQSYRQAIHITWDTTGDGLHLLEEGKTRWCKPLFMEIALLASWNIWKERNRKLFEGVDPSVASWKARLKSDLLLLVHRTKSSLHSLILDLANTL